MLLCLRQECRSLLRLALPVLVVCSVGGVGMTGMPYLPNLCASVPICGRHISARRFCVFRVFCGNTLSACFVGAAETAAPPASCSHGTHSCLGCSPTDFTDLHRCWCLLGVHLSQVHQPSKKCTNRANVPVCFVGAAETAAPPDGYRPPSNRIPFAVQSDTVRRPIGFRPPSDQIPSAVR